MMMKSHSLRKAVEAAKWMEEGKGGKEGSGGQKKSDHRVFEETQFINYGRSERAQRSERFMALTCSFSFCPPPRFLHLQRDMNAAMCFEIGKREVLTTEGSRQPAGWNIKVEREEHDQ